VHAGESVAEGSEPLPREPEGLRVAVDADDAGDPDPGENGLGVTAEPECGVDQDRPLVTESRLQESDDPVEEHRDVGGRGHRSA
jgi:hypothetical protein